MPNLALIMPAYNEEKRIGKTLELYSDFLESKRNYGKFDYSLLVVINNTKDNTKNIVKEFSKQNNRVGFIDLKQGGKGFAVKEGFKVALNNDFDLIGFVDADMATSPEEYWKLIEACEKSHGAIADKYIKGSKIIPRPTIKRILARKAFNFVSRSLLLIPFSDTQCGAKVFRKEALKEVIDNLSMSQWAFDVELLYHLHKKNFKIFSVPTVWEDKEYSTINFWRSGPWMVLAIVRLRLLNSKLKEIVRVYDKLIGFVPK